MRSVRSCCRSTGAILMLLSAGWDSPQTDHNTSRSEAGTLSNRLAM